MWVGTVYVCVHVHVYMCVCARVCMLVWFGVCYVQHGTMEWFDATFSTWAGGLLPGLLINEACGQQQVMQ